MSRGDESCATIGTPGSEHQPSAEQENEFIRRHGFAEYGKWHLGIDADQSENTKQRYRFPYGDSSRLHRCAVLSAESRAGQYKYDDIQRAAARLHAMLDHVEHEQGLVHVQELDLGPLALRDALCRGKRLLAKA